MNVLVAAPHPDDDIIGCGGSIIRHARAQHLVTIVYLTSGDAGSLDCAKSELARIREREAQKAARVMGVSDLIFLRNPDGYLDCGEENLVRIIRIIREKRPDIIYMPVRNDTHRDHAATSELFGEAARRAGGPWFQEGGRHPWSTRSILCYEIWTPLQEISYSEDITPHMAHKMKALKCHRSQLKMIAYHDAAKSLNRFRGITTGRGQYCECFQALSIGSI